MSPPRIRAVIFDMGGTLENVSYDEPLRLQATRGIQAILSKHGLGSGIEISEYYDIVKSGMKRYGVWREETCIELPPERVWSEYVLTDARFPKTRVAEIGEELAYYYDLNFHVRTIRPDAKETLNALRACGFSLGVISNIFSRRAVPDNLKRYGIENYFQVVLASSEFGYRKPDPGIFHQAARLLGRSPSECAYVGDTVSRDVVGAHRAGYALAIQIKSFLTQVSDKETDTEKPDAVIDNLMQVVDLVTRFTFHTDEVKEMAKNIQAIFLDVGNTLRIVIEDAPFQAQARQQLMALVGAQGSVDEFFKKLDVNWKAYRKWSLENLTEASEKELWTRFLLPDFPQDVIAPHSGKLTRLWRDKDGRRVPRHDVKQTVIELSKRGYVLGIIANTITETEIPDWLESDNLTSYFKAVVLSSKVRYRKPGPEIYWEAARRIGIEPKYCAYVGDNPIRDVEGTRQAGFAMTIILPEPGKTEKDLPVGESKPDRFIQEFSDLLQVFPAR